ncbi:glycoside hydrolase family 3 protein [Microdochium bolleyi]|uniref:beta-glucosidase n=1 Tax=Microdochium bolleyi TaxID=196109 RepID=A0A136JD51_9PEZI|nr:glycoside hydrolase family 3 protein [Microdochium bolleyi]
MADINVDDVLKKLSTSDKVELLAGIDFWHTKGLPSHGIPSLRFTDGPNGVRGTKFFNGIPAACFPCGTALGATWNTALLEEAGAKMGDEAKAKGAHVILGPTINMQRSPIGGRGFESIGEDPFLAGLGAAAIVRGIQSTGIQATVKHFVCNDHEHKRNAVDVIVTDRALREIYALPFQLAVRDAQPGAFMTGYNSVQGHYCSENKKLLQDLLRGEWKWDGLVMSDWFGTYSTTDATIAGLDIEMPGPPRFRGGPLAFNVATDKVRSHILDERAREVLKLVKRCAASGVPENAPEGKADTPETAALLRKIGNEGIVVLKNDDKLLPLKKDKKTVVIGPNAKVATYHGGGSASLLAYYAVTPFEGISSKTSFAPKYGVGAYSHKMLPLLGLSTKTPSGKPGVRMRMYNHPADVKDREVIDEVELTKTEMLLVDYSHPKLNMDLWYAELDGTLTIDEDAEWEFGCVVAGTANVYIDDELVINNTEKQTKGDAFFGTSTREEKGTFKLHKDKTYRIRVSFGSIATSPLGDSNVTVPNGALRLGACKVIDPKAEIEHAVKLARDADQVIICAGLNADWETEGNDRADMKLPPGSDELITAVLAANPENTVVVLQSGTPVEMPWVSSAKSLVWAGFGGNETGNTIADVLFGDVNPSGKTSLTFPVRNSDNPAFLNYRTEASRVLYGEDVYIGYRYYEFAERDVLFPFGHGLSYTSFKFSELHVAHKAGDKLVSATFKVANTGSLRGAQVAQLYVSPRQAAKVNRPRKELKGFAKTELGPGEKVSVTIDVEAKYAAAYWDEERDQWCVEAGEYDVIIADSSAVTDANSVVGCFKVDETYWWSGL